MWKAHFGDPQLPKSWPLYLCYLHRLPVSPAQILRWAHLWPSWPLAWNANKSDLAENAPTYPELSFTGQTRVLSPPAFSGSCTFLKPPVPSYSCVPSKAPQCFTHEFLQKGQSVPREASRGWEIVASLGHYSMTPTCLTWEQQSWRCKTENLYRTVRIFFFFIGHVEWNTWESGEKPESSLTFLFKILLHSSVCSLQAGFHQPVLCKFLICT